MWSTRLWSERWKWDLVKVGHDTEEPQYVQLPRSALLQGRWEGLIDLIVCAHSSATPAAGHTQWADCAWGCQMTAARGCPSQPKYVIADHGHTLENSWEHNVINSDKKERENKEKDVPVQKWIVLSVSCCRLRGISGKGSKEFVQMLTWLGQRLWIGVTGLLSARECESDTTQSI